MSVHEPEFRFRVFPDELTTGSASCRTRRIQTCSSLYGPKCNRVQALPNEVILIQNNLPSGYQRDLQLLKECFVPAVSMLKSCLEMAAFMLENIRVSESLLDDERYKYVFSVEEVNRLVLSGMPFRDAYKKSRA